MQYAARNLDKGIVVANRVDLAGSSAQRRQGLLGPAALSISDGLLISPCEAVHTFGMKIPLDVVFLDRHHRVRRVYPAVKANRIRIDFAAASALELPAGTAARTQTQPGDALTFEPLSEGIPCP
jgi:uncharacterized membrane protein (UPF0127 family)